MFLVIVAVSVICISSEDFYWFLSSIIGERVLSGCPALRPPRDPPFSSRRLSIGLYRFVGIGLSVCMPPTRLPFRSSAHRSVRVYVTARLSSSSRRLLVCSSNRHLLVFSSARLLVCPSFRLPVFSSDRVLSPAAAWFRPRIGRVS